jgi:arginyl-tRNA--protein-N-Asp/Glu arginylyltransferase
MMTKSKKPNVCLTLDVYMGYPYGLTDNKRFPFVKCGNCSNVQWYDELITSGWLRLGCIVSRWFCPRCHKKAGKLVVDQCGLVWVNGQDKKQ